MSAKDAMSNGPELRPWGPVSPDRVAVVTGAASGIGRGLAERFAAEGMHVVMADVEGPALSGAATTLAESGTSVLPVVTDVADLSAVEALRDAALSQFGAVHVVCNNAGVGGPHGPLWECPPGEWDWVGPYGVSKHAVAALTETLYFNLESQGIAHVGVSALCPGAVRIQFGTSSRNRPAGAGPAAPGDEAERASAERFDQLSALGASPAEVAGLVLDGIRSRRFYILTSDYRNGAVLRRGEEIVAGGPPSAPVDFT
jgi:NAD(P)-dependent dehydrogenase (short-subunit alcohol dehydrogenase family)